MKIFLKLSREYAKDSLRLHSSSASFYIVVSVLPLAAVVIFSLSHVSPALIKELEDLLSRLLPRELYDQLPSIISGLKSRQWLPIVPISFLASLWSSTKGIGGLCHGVECIFATQTKRGVVGRWLKTAWRTLLFYLLIFISLGAMAISRHITVQSYVMSLFIELRVVLFALLLTLFFAVFYGRLANAKIHTQLAGGAFTALCWMLFSYFYSIYVTYAIKAGSIYAELGSAIFFMLWVYFCVNIILIGAEINKLLLRTKHIN